MYSLYFSQGRNLQLLLSIDVKKPTLFSGNPMNPGHRDETGEMQAANGLVVIIELVNKSFRFL